MVDVTGALPSSPGQLNISLVQSRECGALLRATDLAAYTTVEKDLSSDRPPPPQHPAWAENSTPIYHACIHATLDYVCFYIQRWVHCCWTTPGWSSEMKIMNCFIFSNWLLLLWVAVSFIWCCQEPDIKDGTIQWSSVTLLRHSYWYYGYW